MIDICIGTGRLKGHFYHRIKIRVSTGKWRVLKGNAGNGIVFNAKRERQENSGIAGIPVYKKLRIAGSPA